MQRNTQRRKVFIEDEREGLQKLRKISYVVWKWSMVLERKRDCNFEKNRNGDDLSDMWFEAFRSKKQRRVDRHVGHEGVFRWDG